MRSTRNPVAAWLVAMLLAGCADGAVTQDVVAVANDITATADDDLAAGEVGHDAAVAPHVFDALDAVDVAVDAPVDLSTPDVGPDVGPDVAPDVADVPAAIDGVASDLGADGVPDASADVTPDSQVDVVADVAADAGADVAADSEAPPVGALCFGEIWDETVANPDYDQFAPTIADHCLGTAHQDIEGVESVVILGDSVAQGTPNLAHLLSTDNAHFWRNLLSEWLADTFDVDRGGLLEWGLWKAYDYVSGAAVQQTSGQFHNCSKWGARTDDLLAGGGQLGKCFPDGGSDKRTLVVFTMGGNDVSKVSQVGGEASPEEVAAGYPTAWALAESTITFLEEALLWLKDPQRFPNGSYVIFANPFEFTDGTGETSACPVASLAGYQQWADPSAQETIVIWMLEQYMRLAVETQTDMVWMLEHFCGHGWVAAGPNPDPANRCYRGEGTEIWFDETCIHPNPAGHHAIFEMFQASVAD